MNTYKLVKIIKFPKIDVGQEHCNEYNLTLPGFTEARHTKIRNISTAYYGFEYYEIEHEMLIKDVGLAFGYVNNQPAKMELNGYKKKFIIKVFYNPEENYAFLSESSSVLKDLQRTIKKDKTLGISIDNVELNFSQLDSYIQQFSGAWFRSVSSRVSSSALFGADLKNDPLFKQLNDGANLSSIIIPFKGIQIQLSKSGQISSHQTIKGIKTQLQLIKLIKDDIIDNLIV